MPITSHSTIGPMEQVWAFGWFINRLLNQRPSTFVVVATWIMAVLSLAMLVGIPSTVIFTVASGDWLEVMFPGVVGFLGSACYLLLAVRVTRSYFRHSTPVEPSEDQP